MERFDEWEKAFTEQASKNDIKAIDEPGADYSNPALQLTQEKAPIVEAKVEPVAEPEFKSTEDYSLPVAGLGDTPEQSLAKRYEPPKQTFGQAFADARKQEAAMGRKPGTSSFQWEGKTFTTQTKEDAAPAAKPVGSTKKEPNSDAKKGGWQTMSASDFAKAEPAGQIAKSPLMKDVQKATTFSEAWNDAITKQQRKRMSHEKRKDAPTPLPKPNAARKDWSISNPDEGEASQWLNDRIAWRMANGNVEGDARRIAVNELKDIAGFDGSGLIGSGSMKVDEYASQDQVRAIIDKRAKEYIAAGESQESAVQSATEDFATDNPRTFGGAAADTAKGFAKTIVGIGQGGVNVAQGGVAPALHDAYTLVPKLFDFVYDKAVGGNLGAEEAATYAPLKAWVEEERAGNVANRPELGELSKNLGGTQEEIERGRTASRHGNVIAFDNAKGASQAAGTLARNPGLILDFMGESIPYMAASILSAGRAASSTKALLQAGKDAKENFDKQMRDVVEIRARQAEKNHIEKLGIKQGDEIPEDAAREARAAAVRERAAAAQQVNKLGEVARNSAIEVARNESIKRSALASRITEMGTAGLSANAQAYNQVMQMLEQGKISLDVPPEIMALEGPAFDGDVEAQNKIDAFYDMQGKVLANRIGSQTGLATGALVGLGSVLADKLVGSADETIARMVNQKGVSPVVTGVIAGTKAGTQAGVKGGIRETTQEVLQVPSDIVPGMDTGLEQDPDIGKSIVTSAVTAFPMGAVPGVLSANYKSPEAQFAEAMRQQIDGSSFAPASGGITGNGDGNPMSEARQQAPEPTSDTYEEAAKRVFGGMQPSAPSEQRPSGPISKAVQTTGVTATMEPARPGMSATPYAAGAQPSSTQNTVEPAITGQDSALTPAGLETSGQSIVNTPEPSSAQSESAEMAEMAAAFEQAAQDQPDEQPAQGGETGMPESQAAKADAFVDALIPTAQSNPQEPPQTTGAQPAWDDGGFDVDGLNAQLEQMFPGDAEQAPARGAEPSGAQSESVTPAEQAADMSDAFNAMTETPAEGAEPAEAQSEAASKDEAAAAFIEAFNGDAEQQATRTAQSEPPESEQTVQLQPGVSLEEARRVTGALQPGDAIQIGNKTARIVERRGDGLVYTIDGDPKPGQQYVANESPDHEGFQFAKAAIREGALVHKAAEGAVPTRNTETVPVATEPANEFSQSFDAAVSGKPAQGVQTAQPETVAAQAEQQAASLEQSAQSYADQPISDGAVVSDAQSEASPGKPIPNSLEQQRDSNAANAAQESELLNPPQDAIEAGQRIEAEQATEQATEQVQESGQAIAQAPEMRAPETPEAGLGQIGGGMQINIGQPDLEANQSVSITNIQQQQDEKTKRTPLEDPTQRLAEEVQRIIDGDVQSANGQPFSTKGAAALAAKNRPGYEPVEVTGGWVLRKKQDEVSAAANKSATSPINDLPEPTQAQKEAGNYKKGHIKLHGLDISIENPKGSERSGVSPDGTEWSNTLHSHYGYIRGTVGKDKDHVDVFLTDDASNADTAWVIDQKNQDGTFDEHKVVIGPSTEDAARAAYLANYDAGWNGLGAITPMPMTEFKAWVTDQSKTRKPVAYKGDANETAKMDSPRDEERGNQQAGSPDAGRDIRGSQPAQGGESAGVSIPGNGQVVPVGDAGATAGDVAETKDGAAISYDEFKRQYDAIFKEMMKYSPGEVGSGVFAERMAALADAYPEFAERAERDDATLETTAAAIGNANARRTRLTPHDDTRIAGHADLLRSLARDAGWAQRGGRIIRDPVTNDVTGRTQWIPNAAWYPNLSVKLSGKDAMDAVEAAINGAPMTKKQKDFVSGLLDVADNEMAGEQRYDDSYLEPAEEAIEQVHDDHIDRIIEASFDAEPTPQKELNNDEIDALFGFAGGNGETAEVSGGTSEAVSEGQNEGGNEGGDQAGPAGNAQEGFTLEGQTPEQIRLAAEALAESQRAAAEEASKAKEEAREKRIEEERRQRQKIAAAGFTLNAQAGDKNAQERNNQRRIDEQFAGQQDIFADTKPAEPAQQQAAGQDKDADSSAVARNDLDSALADLADIFGRNTRMNILPEQEQKLLPVLTRVMDAAFRLGYIKFKEAAKFVLDTIRAKIGADVADQISLDHLQGAYIAMAGKYGDKASSKREVVNVESLGELEPAGLDAILEPKEPENARPVQTDTVPNRDQAQDQPDGADGSRDSEQMVAGVAGDGAGSDTGGRVPSSTGAADGRGNQGEDGQQPSAPVNVGEGRSDGADAQPAEHVIEESDAIGKGGLGKKYADNVAAIRLLKQIEAEGRQATPDERKVLAKYVGWGALKGAFDPANKAWAKRHAELKDLLTEEEFAAARRSTLDAHYTSPIVVKAMNDALAKIGYTGGRMLEPSVGIGNFFGLMPAAVRRASDLYGVELDSLTSRMVAAVYPNATIAKATGFENFDIPSEFFDLVQGNPPFGSQPVVDMNRSPYSGFSIHNYFLAKGIDKLRPGGIMAVVVSHNFLDAQDGRARKWIAERANLIGAVRLPDNAFKENAGTEVVTDILIFQKKADSERVNGLSNNFASWLDVVDQVNINNKTGESVTHKVNQVFASQPNLVLGTPSAGGTMYTANQYTVSSNGDIKAQLDDWVKSLPEQIYTPIKRSKKTVDISVPDGVKPGSYFVGKNGDVFMRGNDVMGEKTAEPWTPKNSMEHKRMLGMIALRDALRNQLRMEMSPDASASEIEAGRGKLNGLYNDFVGKYGFLNRSVNRRVFIDDTESSLVQALEFDFDNGVSEKAAEKEGIEPREPSAKPADILSRRVAFPPNDFINVHSANDAMLASLNYRGKIDLAYMEEIYGKSVDSIIDELGDAVYNDPVSGYVLADEYLSGDVKTKLAEAVAASKSDPAFGRNVDALEMVIPADKMPSEIHIGIGATFVPGEVYSQFIEHISGGGATVKNAAGRWLISFDPRADQVLNSAKFGTSDISAKTLFDLLMQGRGAVIKQTVRMADGSTETRVLEKETEAAREKQNVIRQEWQSWIWSDSDRADKLAGIFNEKMNRIVNRKFNGSHLTFPGMSPNMALLDHQKAGVWRGLQTYQVLYDQVVGAGKTFEMVALGMEMRRLGISRKPLYVVPNHLTQQWKSDFARLYPGSNVLAATPEDFSKDNLDRLFARIATGDWDAVIIGHSSLKRIGLPVETETGVLKEQIDELTASIEAMKRERGDRNIVRDMEKIRDTISAKLRDKLAQIAASKTRALTFNELGIDAMFVDELHEFKNLMYFTQMDRTPGLGNPNGSGKAFDLFVKTRWLSDTFGKKAPIIGATGTPVSNSIVEMYNMQRYMQYPLLKEQGMHIFDTWARAFGMVESVYEVSSSGAGYRQSTRFSKFTNLPALMSMYNSFADTVTLDDLKAQEEALGKKFPVPKLVGGKPQNIVAKRSPLQANFMGVPEVSLGEDGKPEFKMNVSAGDRPVIYAEQDGKYVLSVVNGESSAIAGRFETEEEAKMKAVELAISPVITLDKDSIIGKFANLKQITKETKGKVNALSLTGLANKAGLDYRLIDPTAPDFEGSKINLAVDEMMRVYHQWTADKGAQLVFCDLSIPLSAKASYASKARRLYVIDDNGDVQMKRGTMHVNEGHEDLPFFVVERVSQKVRSFDVYDAASGLQIMNGFQTKAQAIEGAKAVMDDAERLQNWIDDAEIRGELTQDRIDNYNNDNDVETEGFEFFMPSDIAGASGATGFSVYDDIKAKLIAKGVPEHEIAFIHDYNTPTAKDKLFKAVNRGDIRFLLGSTPKMGAGTNVQQRLVGLHHIDAPWRPSDLEQREGRIIRRGNMLYERDPDGFEVFIGRYATEQTYDTRRWQILEHKARGIEQLRRYDGETNEIADMDGEAANAADMKAAASGDPLILEETRLRNDLKRLENLKAAHADNRLVMNRSAAVSETYASKTGPAKIAELRAVISGLDGEKNKDGHYPVSVDGSPLIAKRESAVKAIESAFAAVRDRIKLDVDVSYRGIKFSLKKEPYGVDLSSPTGLMGTWNHNENFSPSGFLRRLDNYIDRIPDEIKDVERRIEKATNDAEGLRKQMQQPFAGEKDLEDTRRAYTNVRRTLMAKGPAIPESQKPIVEQAIRDNVRLLAKIGYEEAIRELGLGDKLGPDGKLFGLEFINATTLASPRRGYNEPGQQSPYANLETRPDTTEAQVDAGRSAFAEAEARILGAASQHAGRQGGAVPGLLGSIISRNFKEDGGTSLVGQEVRTSNDLAILAQVYRDPRFETFRVFYVDDAGKIVGQQGHTSRLPATTYLPDDLKAHIAEGMRNHGASGYWITHNHPSGSSAESPADLMMTGDLMENVPGFRGHVIIDHDEYTAILPNGDGTADTETISAPWLNGIDMFASPEVAHPTLGAWMVNPTDAVTIAKSVQSRTGYMTIIGRGAEGKVSMLLEIPELPNSGATGYAKMKMVAQLRRAMRETGTTDVFAVVNNDLPDHKTVTSSGIFTDVIAPDTGRSHADETGRKGEIPHTKADRRGSGYVAQRVWHGTPHVWAPEPGFPHGRPRLDKMGTGEGAQAYGWGWYGAEIAGVAQSYQDMAKRDLINYAGPDRVKWAAGQLSARSKYEDIVDGLVVLGVEPSKTDQVMRDALAMTRNLGSLYQLDIPDDVLPYLLDWDKPLSEQTKEVRKAIHTHGYDGPVRGDGNPTGEAMLAKVRSDIVSGYGPAFEWAKSQHNGDLFNYPDKAASEYLASIGIVGNRYLDGQSRQEGEGSYNYVIWDQGVLNRIAMLERNGVQTNPPPGGFSVSEPGYNRLANRNTVDTKFDIIVQAMVDQGLVQAECA